MRMKMPNLECTILLLSVGVQLIGFSCTESVDLTDDDIPDTVQDSDAFVEMDTGNDNETVSPPDSETENIGDAVVLDPIDDMESGTGRIFEQNGRIGVWYVFNDEIVEQWPPLTKPGEPALTDAIPGGRGNSARAMHTRASGIISSMSCYGEDERWGAGIGFDLAYNGSEYRAYDASAYQGLTFWGRSETPVDVPLLLGTVLDVATEWGGICSAEENICNSHPVVYVPFTTTWKRYWVFFFPSPSMYNDYINLHWNARQYGWNETASLDDLLNVQFFFHHSDYVDAFDFWIDDIAFFEGIPNCDLANVSCLFEPD